MNWWKTAKAGDKVVCVTKEGFELIYQLFPNLKHPAIGEVVSVTFIQEDDRFPSFEAIGYEGQYIEFSGSKYWFGLCCCCFKPVQPKSTEKVMEALRAHLIPSKKQEDA